MKKIFFPLVLNILYSILGWLICIVQIGSSKIMNFNQFLVIALAILQISVGLFVNLFSYSKIKKKDVEKAHYYKKLIPIDCAIIILPYFLVILFWFIGWF